MCSRLKPELCTGFPALRVQALACLAPGSLHLSALRLVPYGRSMPEMTLLRDLAVVLVVAGAVTILFHRLRQPVVLGYILAGLIIGPHTPPFPLIRDEHTIHTLAELGVILLMFALGLEFNLRKLRKVGVTAF